MSKEKENEKYADVLLSHKALHTIIHALNEQKSRTEYADEVRQKLTDVDELFESEADSYRSIID